MKLVDVDVGGLGGQKDNVMNVPKVECPVWKTSYTFASRPLLCAVVYL